MRLIQQIHSKVQVELLNETVTNKLAHDPFVFLHKAYIIKLLNSLKSDSQLTRTVANHFLSLISSPAVEYLHITLLSLWAI